MLKEKAHLNNTIF